MVSGHTARTRLLPRDRGPAAAAELIALALSGVMPEMHPCVDQARLTLFCFQPSRMV